MKWKCSQCGHEVEYHEKPSDRFEHTSTVHIKDNEYRGVKNKDCSKSATHYGTICHGPERGEDYYQHNWKCVGGGPQLTIDRHDQAHDIIVKVNKLLPYGIKFKEIKGTEDTAIFELVES